MTAGPLLRHQILDVPSISWLAQKQQFSKRSKSRNHPKDPMKPMWSNDSCMSHQTGPPKQQLLLQHILLLLQIGRPMLLQCKSEMLDATCCYLQKPLRQTTILLLRQVLWAAWRSFEKMGLATSTWVVQYQQKYVFHSPLPIIWSKTKDTTNLPHIYRNFNISYMVILSISPTLSTPADRTSVTRTQIRGFCCSMVDG